MNAFRAGLDIKKLQSHLRHHSLEMTYIYLKSLGLVKIRSWRTRSGDTHPKKELLPTVVQAGKYSHSLINQSINAVKFYFHQVLSRPGLGLNEVEWPEKPDRLPLMLSWEEVQKILKGTENLKHRCLLQLLYAGGLRIGELINLRITDIESDCNLLLIRGDKGTRQLRSTPSSLATP